MAKLRIIVSALTLSAAGLIGIAVHEGYTDTAVIPTAGDRPTVGFGSTFRDDGTPVRIGDRTTPVRALYTVQAHLAREEQQFRDSLPGVELTQGEYDLYVDFMYQYGIGNWRSSSMRRRLLETSTAAPAQLPGLYRAACDALLAWKKQGGRDCSLPQNWGPKGCKGVWARQQARHAKCLNEQEGTP
ncbi:Lysozyme [uncultured Stenotrophomonas sp.]|uniref:Lysozyme n=1 Tax=uncultured Stenotrophomonas sp. TaxID=165438 RepID=A0A1Y5Q6B3_9GAMM|nr:Lysozyme [uncultured Stenotrophomonas sp.]